jgi:hypothetical protein
MGAFGYSRPATLPHPICFSSRVYSIVQNSSISSSPNRFGCKISGEVGASFPWGLPPDEY